MVESKHSHIVTNDSEAPPKMDFSSKIKTKMVEQRIMLSDVKKQFGIDKTNGWQGFIVRVKLNIYLTMIW